MAYRVYSLALALITDPLNMALYRKNSGQSPGWKLALIFNSLLIVLAVLAARIIAGAFAMQGFGVSPTPEALAETRREIDVAFKEMVPKGAAPRAFWADLVDRELRAGNMPAARGFLLAAPNMLDRSDVKLIRAAADTEPSGTEDQRLIRAALLILQTSVRVRYERAIRPPEIALPIANTADGEDADSISDDVAGPETAPDAETPADAAEGGKAFSLLGDLEDLASHSQKWISGATTDSYELRMSGLGAISSEIAHGIDMGEAASILKAARRARRLQSQYSRVLEQRLDAALPESVLRPLIEDALRETAPLSILGPKVQSAFVQAIDPRSLPRLAVEIEQINRIADATDPASTIALIEHVRDPGDMRRARLIAEAGGERAVALVSQLGADALDIADTGITWSRALILQVMGLAATAMILLWTLISALSQAMMGRRRPIALI